METKTLHFVVDGRFICNLARTWLFNENKPYSTCVDLICKCLVNDCMSPESTKILADKILFGGADLIGNSEDGIEVIQTSHDWFKEKQGWIDSLINEKESTKIAINSFAAQKVRLFDSLDYWSWGNIQDCLNCLTEEDIEFKQKILDIMKRYDNYSDVDEEINDSLNNLREVCDVMQYDDNYGFIKPDGTFIPVPFGDHECFSIKYVKDNDLQKEYFEWIKQNGGSSYTDYMIFALHWVLIHNPGLGIGKVTKNDYRPLTSKQRNTIFNYYCDRNRLDLAKKYLDD